MFWQLLIGYIGSFPDIDVKKFLLWLSIVTAHFAINSAFILFPMCEQNSLNSSTLLCAQIVLEGSEMPSQN